MTADALEIGGLGVGQASGVALFTLGMAIALWPLAHRLLEARRHRVAELRIASGSGEERK